MRIYLKYHLLKNISIISTKQQLMAFSIMILSIPPQIYCPQNTYAYGWNCMLTLSDDNLMPHPISFHALVSRKLSTKFSAQW